MAQQLPLRVPSGLHKALKATAEANGVSLNQWCVTLLAGGIAYTLDRERGVMSETDGSTTPTTEKTMDLTDISTEGRLWTNETTPITALMEGEDGLIEVEVTDVNEVAIHMRHYADEGACLSFYTTRAGALALAEVLRAAAGTKL
jgi:hypothetical protein